MICLLSDTHDNLPAIRLAVPLIKNLNPILVVHCGDIMSPLILDSFRGLPMRFIFGNNDSERKELQKRSKELGFGEILDELELSINEKSICVYHGTSVRTLDERIDSQAYDYVFHGHTHRRRDERIGNTQVVNPGALYQASIYSFASLEVDTGKVTFYDIQKP